jgi:putative intracellular protease/amidase
MRRIVIALPATDFEPTEASVPWKAFRDHDFEVWFATPDGKPAACDPLALTGALFGQIKATPAHAALYSEMIADKAYQQPLTYEQIDDLGYAAIVLPGGHAPGMRPYLESKALQDTVVAFAHARKIIGAICHGSVVLARAIDPATGESVIHGRRLTGLPKRLEWSAWAATAWSLGSHFRTYPEWVQDEVGQAAGPDGAFEPGPLWSTYSNGWCLVDRNLVTARWPGDAEVWAKRLVETVQDSIEAVPTEMISS